jgi:hypothetical protein
MADLKDFKNIVSGPYCWIWVHNYRINKDLRQDIRTAVESLLIFLCRTGFDYNPTFYLMESLHKSSKENAKKNASLVLESILHLHSMDEEIFEEERKINLKPDAIKYYYENFCGKNLKECADNWLEEIESKYPREAFQEIIDLSYVCLLKMVLIHKRRKGEMQLKLLEFENFLNDDLGVWLARERHLAMYYFAELLGSFINTQENMSVDKAKHDLKASAWDIYLLRQPEMLLKPENLPEINLGYICSSEKKIVFLGSLFDIDRIVTRTDKINIGGLFLGADLSHLIDKTGEQISWDVIERGTYNAFKRITTPKATVYSRQKTKFLIEDLEIQLSYLCRG